MESTIQSTSHRSPQLRFPSHQHRVHSKPTEHSRRLPPLVTDHNDSRLLKLLSHERQASGEARYEWLMGKLRRKLESSLKEQQGCLNLLDFEQYLKKMNSFMEEDEQENEQPFLRPICRLQDKTDRRVRLRPLVRRN